MDEQTAFLVLDQPCEAAVGWLISRLEQAGLSTMRTFDLQSACRVPDIRPSVPPETDMSHCQMVVLVVYHAGQEPLTIIAYGYDHESWFSIVDTPQHRADPYLETEIRSLVARALFPTNHLKTLPLNYSLSGEI